MLNIIGLLNVLDANGYETLEKFKDTVKVSNNTGNFIILPKVKELSFLREGLSDISECWKPLEKVGNLSEISMVDYLTVVYEIVYHYICRRTNGTVILYKTKRKENSYLLINYCDFTKVFSGYSNDELISIESLIW